MVVFQYKAPVSKAFPSLSTVGSEAFAPRYLSSIESKLAAAAVALPAAAVALPAAAVALLPALVSLTAAAAAEAAADVVLPKMLSI